MDPEDRTSTRSAPGSLFYSMWLPPRASPKLRRRDWGNAWGRASARLDCCRSTVRNTAASYAIAKLPWSVSYTSFAKPCADPGRAELPENPGAPRKRGCARKSSVDSSRKEDQASRQTTSRTQNLEPRVHQTYPFSCRVVFRPCTAEADFCTAACSSVVRLIWKTSSIPRRPSFTGAPI